MIRKPKPLKFDWDKGNKDKNWQKHRVGWKECEEIFLNGRLKIFPDKGHSQKEKRFLAYGKTNKGRKLAMVFTLRRKKIRIISARYQNKKERSVYEQK